MVEHWIALSSLPAEGLSLVVDNTAVWTEPAAEFGLNCTVHSLAADVFLLPQEEGFFVRGRFTGVLDVPCDRCAEAARIDIDQRFESFEPLPGSSLALDDGEDADAFSGDDADTSVVRMGESGPEINLAALLWEEFSLTLPVHPLCQPECRGLCLMCGINLNDGTCACARDEGDPRLDILRKLTLSQ